MNTTVLVAGSEGSLMQAVIPTLLAQGHTVIGADNFFRYGTVERERPYTFIQGDLCDEAFVEKIFTEHSIDYVLQAAARIFGVRGFHKYPADILSFDVRLHQNILASAKKHGVKRVAYISSSMVYERATSVPSKEEDADDMLVPLTAYGLSKLVGERLCRAYYAQHGLPYTIWRPFNILTPFERAEGEVGISHVFADFIDKLLIKKENPMDMLGDGKQVRSFTWIYEVAEAIGTYSFDDRTALGTFNLGQYNEDGTAEATTMQELAQKIFDKGKERGILPADATLAITHRDDPLIQKTDVRLRVPDSSHAHNTFGWQTKIKVDDALDRCITELLKAGLVTTIK